MKPLKVRVSISLDEDLVERARAMAEYDDRSLSQFINLALRDYLAKLKDREEKMNQQ